MDLLAVLLVVCITAAAVARSLPDVDSDPPVHVYKTLQDIKICSKLMYLLHRIKFSYSKSRRDYDNKKYHDVTKSTSN